MYTILFVVIIGMCYGARLENTYLPPGSAASAGGNGQILSVPKQSLAGNSFTGFSGAGAVNNKYQHDSFGAQYQPKAQEHIPILRYNNDNFNGQYRYEYETANGIAVHEEGHRKSYDNQEVHGGYSYTAPDGQQISVQYIANEHGFQPVGSHIPAIPEPIKKSLEFNAQQEAKGVIDDGSYKSGHDPQTPGQYIPPVVIDAKSGTSLKNQYLTPKVNDFSGGDQNGAKGYQYSAPKLNNQYVPPQLDTKINNQYGAPKINNQYGTPKINNQYGAPKINSQYGAPKINSQYGAPKSNNQNGASKIDNQYGAPKINNQYGAPKSNNQNGATKIGNQYGAPKVDNQYGAPKINNQYGAPKINNEYGAPKMNVQYGAPKINNQYVPPKVNNQYLSPRPNNQYLAANVGEYNSYGARIEKPADHFLAPKSTGGASNQYLAPKSEHHAFIPAPPPQYTNRPSFSSKTGYHY